MSKFAIVRLEKVKNAESFNGRLSHNNRSYFSKNIDKTRTSKNIVLTESNYKNIDDFAEAKRTQIREHNLKNGTKHRMLRKTIDKKTDKKEYKAMAQELVISTSHKALTDEESIEYLKRADIFLREHFENCEVIQSVIHMDEKTPHLHFFVSYFDEKNCKFSQEELRADNKTDLDTIRDLFQEEVAGSFGLVKQDGSVVAPDEWQQANHQIGQLKEQLEEKEIAQGWKDTENPDTPLTKDEVIKQLYQENKELKAKLQEKDQEIEDLKSDLATLQKQSNAYYGLNQDLKEEINSLKSIINDLESQKRVLDDKSIELDTKNDSRPNMSIFDKIVKNSKELNQKLGIDQEEQPQEIEKEEVKHTSKFKRKYRSK